MSASPKDKGNAEKGLSKTNKIKKGHFIEDIHLVIKIAKKVHYIGLFELLISQDLCHKLTDKQLTSLEHIYKTLHDGQR